MTIVSIHAPLKGATSLDKGLARQLQGFNSRTPKGCDRSRTHLADHRQPVSIHAPLKGATAMGGLRGAITRVSIHAPLKGATTEAESMAYAYVEFQFTHP